MATTVIRVPETEEPAHIFNQIIREMKFDPGLLAEMFDDMVKVYNAPMPHTIQKVYGEPVRSERVVEIRENGMVTSIPLEVTAPAAKPNGYDALTTRTMATPAIMPKKKKQ